MYKIVVWALSFAFAGLWGEITTDGLGSAAMFRFILRI